MVFVWFKSLAIVIVKILVSTAQIIGYVFSVVGVELVKLFEQLSLHETELGLVYIDLDHVIVVRVNWIMHVKGFSFRIDILKSLILLEERLVVQADYILSI